MYCQMLEVSTSEHLNSESTNRVGRIEAEVVRRAFRRPCFPIHLSTTPRIRSHRQHVIPIRREIDLELEFGLDLLEEGGPSSVRIFKGSGGIEEATRYLAREGRDEDLAVVGVCAREGQL